MVRPCRECSCLSLSPNRPDRLAQLSFRNYTLKQDNNIYYFSARSLWGRAFIGLFPAVIEGHGGIYCAVSYEGVKWSAPLRVLASPVRLETRTQDHPLEQDATLGVNEAELTVEHQVYLHLGLAG